MAIILNDLQKDIFSIVAKDLTIQKDFYFSGGTALSEVYLHHRESVDLDFFSENPFKRDVVEKIMDQIGKAGISTSDIRKIHDRYTFETRTQGSPPCILDFCHYPFRRLERGKKTFMRIEVDSIYDIWLNKWCALFDRSEAKDVMDIVSMVRKGGLRIDDEWLKKTASDVKKKFSLSISPRLMVEQFNTRLATSRVEEMKRILYIDVGSFRIFE